MARKFLAPEEVAADLSDKLGKKITTQSVVLWSKKPKTPKAWAAALDLDADPNPDPPLDSEPGNLTFGARTEDEPPKPPSGSTAPITDPAPKGGEFAFVQTRIAQCYNMAGAGVSMASGNEGYSVVFSMYSPDIAEAWIKAAQDGNPVAKRIVAIASAGGATGELVTAHLVLLGGILYVGDKAPAPVASALDSAYGGKLRPHRDATVARRVAAEAERTNDADLNGSGHLDSPRAVGDFTR